MQKASIDAIIARKLSANSTEKIFKEIDVPLLGMSITAVKMPLDKALDIVDTYTEDKLTNVKKLEFYKELIYKSVPLFQDTKLQEAYECVEPFDIVTKILEENLVAIMALGDEISKMYGLGNEIAEELKN